MIILVRQKLSLILLLVPVVLFPAGTAVKRKLIDVNRVRTDAGIIKGRTTDDGSVKIFVGVPFAAPPVGSLRWKPPQPVSRWNGVRECITPPLSAMQAKPVPFLMWTKEFMAPEGPLSEDCLYLNIMDLCPYFG